MTATEIFSKINQHMIEGLMVHSQISDYYNFLGLHGYSKCHEYHFFTESKSYRTLNNRFFKYYNKLIPEMQNTNPNIIPKEWYNYTRQQVDAGTRKTGVQTALQKWVEWEKETKALYEKMYQELMVQNDVFGAGMVKDLIKDVTEELAQAYQKQLKLKSMDFDIVFIMDEQEERYKKYRKEIKKLFK
jgi:hypothetical protein